MKKDIRVISFDLDGVIFDGPSAAFPLAQHLGLGEKFIEVYSRMSKEKKRIEDSIREGSKIWKGVAAGTKYNHLVLNLPLMTGAEETIKILKERGFIVGCISSGVSQFFMEPFLKRLNLDFAHSNILGEENGAHSGEVEYIMGSAQKAETALRILQQLGFNGGNLASIGDGTNDLDIFSVSAFSVAFNPESEEVSKAASVTIHSKDLKTILPYFE